VHWQYWPITVTPAPGTQPAAPHDRTWNFTQGILAAIQIQIPAGHNGRTGIRIVYHGTVIIPWSLSGWIIASGETFTFDWDDEIMATGLVVETYNTDITPHNFYLRAKVLPTVEAAPAQLTGNLGGAIVPEATIAAVRQLGSSRGGGSRDRAAAGQLRL
jgi:hypothetical protein